MARNFFDLALSLLGATRVGRRKHPLPPGVQALSTAESDRRLSKWVRWARASSLDVDLPEHRFHGTVEGMPVDLRVGAQGTLALPIGLDTRGPADAQALFRREWSAGKVDGSCEPDLEGVVREAFRAHPTLALVRFQPGRAHLMFAWNADPEDVRACLTALSDRERGRAQTYRE